MDSGENTSDKISINHTVKFLKVTILSLVYTVEMNICYGETTMSTGSRL